MANELAQFYYEWGNEPTGMVSTGYYDENDTWRSTGYMTIEEAKTHNLKYNCPFS